MKRDSRSTTHFIIDSVAFASLLFLLSTGFLIYFVLPPGQGNASVWSLTRHEWGKVHLLFALIFTVTMIIHILLHWSWIDRKIRGRRGEEKLLRYVIAILVAACLVAIALIPYLGPRGYDTGHEGSQSASGKHLSREQGRGLSHDSW